MYLLTSSEVLKQYDFMNLPAVLIILIAHLIYSSIMPYLYIQGVKMYLSAKPAKLDDEF